MNKWRLLLYLKFCGFVLEFIFWIPLSLLNNHLYYFGKVNLQLTQKDHPLLLNKGRVKLSYRVRVINICKTRAELNINGISIDLRGMRDLIVYFLLS
jgi:hypothetical protein